MTKASIEARLSERTISIDKIYLDPNNLRLSGIRKETSETRFFEERVQRSVRIQMEKFGIESLKKSFKQNGVLPIDKIVVREINPEHFIVVEGNRRIAAIKSLLEEHESGEIDLSKERIADLRSHTVLVLASPSREDTLLIQGLRHVPGIRAWGAYQRAEAISYLVDSGLDYRKVSDVMGGILGPSAVGRYYRGRQAFRQFMEDDEYGRSANPDYFTYFDETLKRGFKKIREWLEWNSKTYIFKNEENRKTFYKWLTGNGDKEARQIRSVVELRHLPEVFENLSAKKALFSGSTVEYAKTQIIVPAEWRLRLSEFKDFLRTEIPITEEFKEEDIALLEEIRTLTTKILQRISR